MIFEQYKHQAKEYLAQWKDRARAYFWQMRTGKSKMTIDNACALFVAGLIDGVIVIAPNGVHLNWVFTELPRHAWRRIDWLAFAWQFSRGADNKKAFEDFLESIPTVDLPWLSLNLESMTRKEIKNALARFQKLCPRFLLVVDEVHHFRRPGAKRTARARAIARKATFVRTLSGTSLDNSPLHAFSQFELLEKGALGFERFEDFKDHFAVFKKQRMKGGRSFEKLDHYINLEELKEKMAPYVSIVLRTDCEDLPPVIPDVRYVEPTTEQLKLYRAILKSQMDELEKVNIYDAVVGGARLGKLQQVLSGFLYQDDGTALQIGKTNPKLEALLEEVEMHDGKVIVWCAFTQDILNTVELLENKGITTTQYHGKMDSSAREEGLAAFLKPDGPRVLVGQPQAGGEGRDMSSASKIIWLSQTPNNIVRTQANERATKVGGEPTQLIDIIAPNSVDTYYLGLVEDKRTVADDISRHGLRAVLERIQL
jgi:hypothetical protein